MTRGRAGRPRGLVRVVRAVAARPGLWQVAFTTAARLAPPRWWRRWPPSPAPDARYWRFRMETTYGGEGDAAPEPRDVVEFLEWCRAHRARRGRRWSRPRRS